MSLDHYRKYKDGRGDWPEKIPSAWGIQRLKYATELADKKVHADEDDPKPYVGLENIESFTGRIVDLDPDMVPSGTANSFTASHTLFGKLRPYLAKACNPNFSGLCSTELIVLKGKEVNRRYLLYYLLSDGFIHLVDSSTYGSKMPRANWDFIGNCSIPIPHSDEQETIANFLDSATAKIDDLVAKKRALIELLEEKRKALITRCVTRGLPPDAAKAAGLDPNPKMKPSGIDWLGEIPEVWEVMKLKRAFRSVDYGISDSLEPEGEVAILRMGNIQDGQIDLNELKYVDEVDEYLLLKHGDLLYNRTNSLDQIGKVGMIKGDSDAVLSFASYLVRLRTNDQCCPEYFSYLLNTEGLLEVARSSAFVSIGQCNLNPTRYGMIDIAVPPLAEQQKMADYLSEESQCFNALKKSMGEAIERLIEYRSALITAAVTGKIDVREVSP
jgi:type I restriction enzyme S subunit